jgi:hypothetical protein
MPVCDGLAASCRRIFVELSIQTSVTIELDTATLRIAYFHVIVLCNGQPVV